MKYMPKRLRIALEIDDAKLLRAMKKRAKTDSRTLKYVVKEAFKYYLEQFKD